jgi:serine/threonine protein phosphatase PrpC
MTISLPTFPDGLGRWQPADTSIGGLRRVADGAAAFYCSPCPGGSGRSEDALAIIPLAGDSALLVVADGMGGLPGGREAAAIAIDTLIGDLTESPPDPLVSRSRLLDAIEHANQRILDIGNGSATTLAVAEIGQGSVRAFHVGDSEIVVFGQRGRLRLQSVPHSPVGFAFHAGLLDETQAISHEDRHLVSNALGTRDMRIEVGSTVPLADHDTVVVCSDGLADNLTVGETIDGLRCGPLDKAFSGLVERAMQRMTEPRGDEPSKPDDISVIAFRRKPGASLERRLTN